jgi:cyclase
MSHPRALDDLGNGCYAWIQAPGSWGWSNAGLVMSEGESLLVDTLFDLALTQEMLDAMQPITAAAPIRNLVNTHANGDHCYGNQLVTDAEIIATEACATEMSETPPELLAAMMAATDDLGDLGVYLEECFGEFDFEGITLTPPTRTFTKRLEVPVGSKVAECIEVGPAHTRGDLLVHVPGDSVVFTGDILFIDSTPLVWAGPISNWIAACDLILELNPETIVPGHGPLTDADGVRQVQEYLSFVHEAASARHEAGLSAAEALDDIALGEFRGWLDAERLAVNIANVYQELSPGSTPADVVALFGAMSSASSLR